MFEFINDMFNYETRKVDCWQNEDEDQMVSTARVSDGTRPYETAFQHPEYNDGKIVIVEAYDTLEDARAGHTRWLKLMTEGPLPESLRECCNAGIAQLLGALSDDHPDWDVYPRRSLSVPEKQTP